MIKYLFLIIISVLFSSSVYCNENREQAALAMQFSILLGLEELMEESKIELRVKREQDLAQLATFLKKSLPNFPQQVLEDISDKFAESIRKRRYWDSEEAARIYTSSLTDALSIEELCASIQFFSSPVGLKLLKAVDDAEAKLDAYIRRCNQQEREAEFQNITAEMRLILDKIELDFNSFRDTPNEAQQ